MKEIFLAEQSEIDVFVTTYNQALWVEDSVRSVLGQEFRKTFNLYVYDDHSNKRQKDVRKNIISDSPSSILHRLRREGVDITFGRENVGVSAARNTVAAKGTAPWMLFLDGDDKLAPRFLELLWRRAQITKADIIYPKIAIFTDGPGLAPHGSIEQGEFNRIRLMKGNFLPVTSLFRRIVWDEVGGFDTSMKDGFEDWEFWIRAALADYEFWYEPEAVLFYRHHTQARSLGANQRYAEIYNYIRTKHANAFNTTLKPTVEWV